MSSAGSTTERSSPITFGGSVAAPEKVQPSVSSYASPGMVEANAGMIPLQSLPPVSESPGLTPRKRNLEIKDDGPSPETPNTRFRSQITAARHTDTVESRVLAYQPLRLVSASIQGIEAEEVSDLDLVAYLSIKYDAEIKKSESYRVEMFEHRDVAQKLEEMYKGSMSEVSELSAYVGRLENVGG